MEEILPILLGLLWLIVTIISRNKKRKASKSAFQNKSKESSGKDILEEIFSIGNSKVQTPEPLYYEEEEPYQQVDIQPTVDNTIKADYLMNEISEFKEEGSRAISEERIKQVEDRRYSFSKRKDHLKVNLKNAFIYDAIFKPPYIKNYF